MIDPEAFEIAFTGVAPPTSDDSDGDDPIPLCATCGSPIVFPEVVMNWRHYRGGPTAFATHQIFDLGHTPEPAWYLCDEDPTEL